MATRKTVSTQVPLADSEEERLETRLQVMARLGVGGERLRQWRISGLLVPIRVGARSGSARVTFGASSGDRRPHHVSGCRATEVGEQIVGYPRS